MLLRDSTPNHHPGNRLQHSQRETGRCHSTGLCQSFCKSPSCTATAQAGSLQCKGQHIKRWIQSFLSNRKQQGTVLGPQLLLTFINDLSDMIKSSSSKLFADDSAVFKVIENDHAPPERPHSTGKVGRDMADDHQDRPSMLENHRHYIQSPWSHTWGGGRK